MKAKERKLARNLRKLGWSVRAIAKRIKCAKGSVSKWVRDIPLTSDQIEKLKSNQDKGRAKAAQHPNSPKQVWTRIREDIIRVSSNEIPSKFSSNVLKVVGAALYWAEGAKTSVNQVSFCNSDPGMVILMARFFRDICNVSNSKFRGGVHIHPHLDREKAEKFWSRISGIPRSQFHKTQVTISRASKQKKDSLPLGTFKIVISDVRLQSRLRGWIKGMEGWTKSRAVSAIG